MRDYEKITNGDGTHRDIHCFVTLHDVFLDFRVIKVDFVVRCEDLAIPMNYTTNVSVPPHSSAQAINHHKFKLTRRLRQVRG